MSDVLEVREASGGKVEVTLSPALVSELQAASRHRHFRERAMKQGDGTITFYRSLSACSGGGTYTVRGRPDCMQAALRIILTACSISETMHTPEKSFPEVAAPRFSLTGMRPIPAIRRQAESANYAGVLPHRLRSPLPREPLKREGDLQQCRTKGIPGTLILLSEGKGSPAV